MHRLFFILTNIIFFLASTTLSLFAIGCQSTSPENAQPSLESKAQQGYMLITPQLLKPHLSFLASDELEGRETGKRGQKIAATYIATQFEKFGLKPLGENGTYFQKFPLKEQQLGTQSSITISHTPTEISKRPSRSSSKTLVEKDVKIFDKFFTDFYGFGRNLRDAPREVEGMVVFAGYGIDDETNYNYSDYKLIKAKNKIVLVLEGEPQEDNPQSVFAGLEKTKWSDARVKTRAAVEQKATALLIVSDIHGKSISEQLTPEVRDLMVMSNMSLINDQASSTGSSPLQPKQSLPVFYISSDIANHILKPSGTNILNLKKSIDTDGKPVSLDLPYTTVSLKVDYSEKIVSAENVCAILEGSDPELKKQAIVISSHYDHVGMGVSGNIYNGADDDGSGTTGVLALAEAFAKNGVAPKHSLIFLTVSGEEKGLLGSDYFTQNPTFKLSNIITNLNIDMIGRLGGDYEQSENPNYIYVIGSDKISVDLDSILQVENEKTEQLKLDYKYNSDDDPNRFYYRSDHYNFAKNDIPVIFFFNGTHVDYHGVGDEVSKIHFEKMSKIVRLIFGVGWNLGNREVPLSKKSN